MGIALLFYGFVTEELLSNSTTSETLLSTDSVMFVNIAVSATLTVKNIDNTRIIPNNCPLISDIKTPF